MTRGPPSTLAEHCDEGLSRKIVVVGDSGVGKVRDLASSISPPPCEIEDTQILAKQTMY